MKPAKAEQIAPRIKETATKGEEFSASALKPKRIATQITNILSTLYSGFQNDIAPSAMLAAILPIRSVPTSCFEPMKTSRRYIIDRLYLIPELSRLKYHP